MVPMEVPGWVRLPAPKVAELPEIEEGDAVSPATAAAAAAAAAA